MTKMFKKHFKIIFENNLCPSHNNFLGKKNFRDRKSVFYVEKRIFSNLNLFPGSGMNITYVQVMVVVRGSRFTGPATKRTLEIEREYL